MSHFQLYEPMDKRIINDVPVTGTFSGKRIKRGLYGSADGMLLNADVNGAYNIMRKGKQDFHNEELSNGLLENPMRIQIQ